MEGMLVEAHCYTSDEVRSSLLLYAVTDRAWLEGRDLADCVEQAIAGGVTFVQLREKNAPRVEVAALARNLLAVCREAGVPFVVNDEVEIALEVGADGVHVGQDDMPCADVRAMMGPDAIVGVSVQTVEQALAAQADGASYLCVGALFPTPMKPFAADVTFEEFKAICNAVEIPVVGLGGLNAERIPQLSGMNAAGAALISAIFSADDCEWAAHELRAICEETFK